MSSSTGSDGKKMLKLKSSDSQVFKVEEEKSIIGMSSSTGGDGKKMLKLKSSDSQVFEVEEEVATRSLLIKQRLGDNINEISIPSVDGKTLSKVMEWCRKHSGGEDSMGISKKEYEDWKSKFMDFDLKNELCDITFASSYLEVKDLFECCCSKTVDLLIRGTPEQLREIFNSENDFSKEEEEEEEWAFDDW